ncbi:MAG TPA: hypothetical protein VFR05_01075 [Terriglobia bacterium]|nr:hypothetical protein [Terriglobia bacterium]
MNTLLSRMVEMVSPRILAEFMVLTSCFWKREIVRKVANHFPERFQLACAMEHADNTELPFISYLKDRGSSGDQIQLTLEE